MAKYKKKKVVKTVTTVKKSRKATAAKKARRKARTLPPMVIPLTKPKRKIPKNVTKRTPLKRKVPKRKSAVELERRVQFAKDNPLMPRKPKPRSRSAFDPRMLLAPLGIGVGVKAAKGIKAARKAIKPRLKTKKRKY